MAGANAADKIITNANTCTVDVLGVSDNNATANTIATWDLIDYTLDPGEYLSVTDTSVTETTCPAGSYCVGGGFTVETANNSIAQCPAEYPNSAEGAGADTQCYTACTVDMVAKATAVTGNDYYGSGVDTCEPTACIAGWHVKPGLDIGETIGEEIGANYAYIDNAGTFEEIRGSKGQEYYGITEPMSFAIDYGERGIITGRGRYSSQEGNNNNSSWTNPTIVDELSEEAYGYCYCRIDNYISSGGTVMKLSGPWVYLDDAVVMGYECTSACAEFLFSNGGDYIPFRGAILGAIPALPATCAANTINIDWNPDNDGAHIKNMCTYEGAIEVPADPVKPGYTFMGWKLVE